MGDGIYIQFNKKIEGIDREVFNEDKKSFHKGGELYFFEDDGVCVYIRDFVDPITHKLKLASIWDFFRTSPRQRSKDWFSPEDCLKTVQAVNERIRSYSAENLFNEFGCTNDEEQKDYALFHLSGFEQALIKAKEQQALFWLLFVD